MRHSRVAKIHLFTQFYAILCRNFSLYKFASIKRSVNKLSKGIAGKNQAECIETSSFRLEIQFYSYSDLVVKSAEIWMMIIFGLISLRMTPFALPNNAFDPALLHDLQLEGPSYK